MTERIQHPLIGTVVGKAENGVAQFLGLKYASLTDRLSAPQICSNYSNVEIDATKIG
jgi:carboxylesterase type B